jgi:protein phosphatase 1H
VAFRTINSGKSKLNEDQARVQSSFLRIQVPEENSNSSTTNSPVEGSSQVNGDSEPTEFKEYQIPYHYFAVFDGHAGAGAAVAAAARLHLILHVCEVHMQRLIVV